MSVIIPNMKMPMSCLACPLAREMFGCLVCVGFFKENLIGRRVYKIDLKESDTDFNRPDWCPLVPLPEGHGDLMDKAAFETDIKNRYCTGCDNYKGLKCKACWVDDMLGEVEDAPTIVPAEGELRNDS